MIILKYQEDLYLQIEDDHDFWDWTDIFVVSGGMGHKLVLISVNANNKFYKAIEM